MREPYQSIFRGLIRQGAGAQDIYSTTANEGITATPYRVSEAFIEREVERVALHRKGLVPLLENFAGPVDSILDVGCSTGGGTVALALSTALGAREVIGVDPNPLSIEAARVRACAYDLPLDRVRFEVTTAGQRLPFDDDYFQLTVCVSVLEFISSHTERLAFAAELLRVTSPLGFIYLATPNPLRLREYHTGRFLGNLRHREGHPWESPPWSIRRMFPGCHQIPVVKYQVRHALCRRHLPGAAILASLGPVLAAGLTWMRFLFRKSPGADTVAPV